MDILFVSKDIIKIVHILSGKCSDPCSPPGLITHGTYAGGPYNIGDEITFTCNEGYKWVSGSLFRTCQANGTWAGVPPECEGEL